MARKKPAKEPENNKKTNATNVMGLRAEVLEQPITDDAGGPTICPTP